MPETYKAQLEHALRTIRITFSLFGAEGCCLSFNGGKDSTVLLHLIMQAFPDEYKKMHFVFFQNDNEFPEVQQFVKDMDAKYKLNIHYSCASFREGLAELLSRTKIKAIFLGTRVGDPHSTRLSGFCPSDEGWPVFMRVHPVLGWEYAHVWEYLAGKDYCSLYNQGYTSLGTVKDTKQNPKLRGPDGKYRPASDLVDGRYERCGRANFVAPDESMPSVSTHSAAQAEGPKCVFARPFVMSVLGVSMLLGLVTGVAMGRRMR